MKPDASRQENGANTTYAFSHRCVLSNSAGSEVSPHYRLCIMWRGHDILASHSLLVMGASVTLEHGVCIAWLSSVVFAFIHIGICSCNKCMRVPHFCIVVGTAYAYAKRISDAPFAANLLYKFEYPVFYSQNVVFVTCDKKGKFISSVPSTDPSSFRAHLF